MIIIREPKTVEELDEMWEEIKRRIEEKDFYIASKLMKYMYQPSYEVIRLLVGEENEQLKKQIIKIRKIIMQLQ